MLFNLEDLNPGTKFFFNEKDESKGSVTLRVCSGDDLKEIRKRTSKKKVEYRRGQRIDFIDTDEDKENAELWDFCIMGWEGVLDKDKNPIPCNKETKVLLMGKSPAFSQFVTQRLTDLTELADLETERLEKN